MHISEQIKGLESTSQLLSAVQRPLDTAPTALHAAIRDNHECTRNLYIKEKTCNELIPGSTNETTIDKRIIVAILYNGERELLWIQLNEMHLAVDKFIIVEGNVTFAGKPRVPLFDIEDPLFQRFRGKLVHSIFCTQEYQQDFRTSDFTVEFMAREVPTLDKSLLRDHDILITLDTDEIPSVAFINLLRECHINKASLRMFEFFLSLQFTRLKKPSQVRGCTGSLARKHHGCRRVSAVMLREPRIVDLQQPKLSTQVQLGTLLGKFGGKNFFFQRLMTNANEQKKELNETSVSEDDFWRTITSRPLFPATITDLNRLCTVVYEPSYVLNTFFDWRIESPWHQKRQQSISRGTASLPVSNYKCSYVF